MNTFGKILIGTGAAGAAVTGGPANAKEAVLNKAEQAIVSQFGQRILDNSKVYNLSELMVKGPQTPKEIGVGIGTRGFAFLNPGKEKLTLVFSETDMKFLNESSGKFTVAKGWTCEKKDIAVNGKPYEISIVQSQTGVAIVMIDKTDLTGKNGKVLLLGGNDFKLYKDKKGDVAINVNDFGVDYLLDNGKAMTSRFDSTQVLDKRTWQYTTKRSPLKRSPVKFSATHDNTTITDKKGDIGKITFNNVVKTDSLAIENKNQIVYGYDDFGPGQYTKNVVVGHANFILSTNCLNAVTKGGILNGKEYAQTELKLSDPNSLLSETIRVGVLIGDEKHGMVIVTTNAETKVSRGYVVDGGKPVVKLTDGKWAYSVDKATNTIAALVSSKGKSEVVVIELDKTGVPIREAKTDVYVDTKNVSGITLSKGKVTLKVNNKDVVVLDVPDLNWKDIQKVDPELIK